MCIRSNEKPYQGRYPEDPSWETFNPKSSMKDTARNFKTFLQKKSEKEKNDPKKYSAWLDGPPVTISLVSFASTIASTAIGESPLYFILTDGIKNNEPNFDGFTAITRPFNEILGTNITQKIFEDMHDVKTVDNGKILLFLFDKTKQDDWQNLGWWATSHGSIVEKVITENEEAATTNENGFQNLKDLYNALNEMPNTLNKMRERANASIEDANSMAHKIKLFDIDEIKKEEKDDIHKILESAKLKRSYSIYGVGETRSLAACCTNKICAPLMHRFQARIPFNVPVPGTDGKFMNLSPHHETSFSLSPKEDQKKLRAKIKLLAKRFLCAVSGYDKNRNVFGTDNSKTDAAQKWKHFQETYPYFKDKTFDIRVCTKEKLGY